MRSEKEMFDLLLNFAKNDKRILVVGMEGSRTNINVPADDFRDYDITYIVSDLDSFTKNDDWLDVFGKRIFMQKPEAMALFPAEINGFSYLMLFEDDIKIDLTILPIELLNEYLKNDNLIKILLDKDGFVLNPPIPTDKDYWIYKPSAVFFDDCCNEFWFVSTYIAKGLFRNELLFATWHMEQIEREELFRMLSWKIGIDCGYNFSIGKHNKFIYRYLTENEWSMLMKTYYMGSVDNCWTALQSAQILFRKISRYVADNLGYTYPDYDFQITSYINKHKNNINV